MTQQTEIRWDDSLPPFAGPGSELPEIGYAVEAVADGTNFGNPEALIEIVKSLLSDGSVAVLEGWDNRQVPIRLRVSAPTRIAGPALADAEKALMLAVLAKPKAPLVYVPPAQDSETCVFDVVAAKLEQDTSDTKDFEEVMREYRYYLLTLTCLPFVRAEHSVVVPALALPEPPGDITVTVIDDCSAATPAWGTTDGGSVSVVDGGTALSTTASPPRQVAGLRRIGSVDVGASPYIRVTATARMRPPGGGAGYGVTPTFNIDGAAVAPVAIVGDESPTATREFYLPANDFATIAAIYKPGGSWGAGAYWEVKVAELALVSGLPQIGSTRQQARTAAVAGSAPTQAAIRLYDATPATLGNDVLVYTSRSSWVPSLRQYRVSSATVNIDANRVSGARNTLAAQMKFAFSAAAVAEGTYALMALMNITTSGDLTWSARVVDAAGAATLGSEIVVSGTVTLDVTSGYEAVALGSLALPVVPVEGDQKIELTLTGTANMTVDEVWPFNLDDGVLTWVRNAAVEWIEIRSPELGDSRPSVYGGTGTVGEGGVCIDWSCESFGTHRFDPGLMKVFTMTSEAVASQSELEFYPRYHSHVEGSAAA